MMSWKIERLEIPSLMIDVDNPRYEDGTRTEKAAMNQLVQHQGKKLLVLAGDIVQQGSLSPAELVIVTPTDKDGTERFLVLEGNRRVTTLKLLSNSVLRDELLSGSLKRRFTELAAKFSISEVDCAVFTDPQDADHWITLRHSGEQQGAGVVKWGSKEIQRHKARVGGPIDISLQALDAVREAGLVTEEQVGARFPVTSLRRLLRDPVVRFAVGLDLNAGELVSKLPADQALRGVAKMVRDLGAMGDMNVQDIRNREKRQEYLSTFGAADLPDAGLKRADVASKLGSLQGGEPPESGTPSSTNGSNQPVPKPRSRMIPRSFRPTRLAGRPAAVCRELKSLSLEQYPNAVGVLLRVFVELVVSDYMDANLPSSHKDAPLRSKVGLVLDHLGDKLPKQQALPIRQLQAKAHKGLLHGSATTMNQYVHNPDFHPTPTELRASWDKLAPFLEKVIEHR